VSGRFAPSPTGPLHQGSLVTAIGSYLEAKKRKTPWLLRIDDLDGFRSMRGARDEIMRSLDAHGLHWDGPVQYQSNRIEVYMEALSNLEEQDVLFYCNCSRKLLKNHRVYPGTCRKQRNYQSDRAIRISTKNRVITCPDQLRGNRSYELETAFGDFIIVRRDQIISYHLATAVDDGSPEIDHVVRGYDLLHETPKQQYLMELLNLRPPEYAHLPVLTDEDGVKLSKRTGATPVNPKNAKENWFITLRLLGLNPPVDAANWEIKELKKWGMEAWQLELVPQQSAMIMDT
tara:strand:+ start:135 stop:998 length:864 start_codon:yes stop_codon:yes gene_type:complete